MEIRAEKCTSARARVINFTCNNTTHTGHFTCTNVLSRALWNVLCLRTPRPRLKTLSAPFTGSITARLWRSENAAYEGSPLGFHTRPRGKRRVRTRTRAEVDKSRARTWLGSRGERMESLSDVRPRSRVDLEEREALHLIPDREDRGMRKWDVSGEDEEYGVRSWSAGEVRRRLAPPLRNQQTNITHSSTLDRDRWYQGKVMGEQCTLCLKIDCWLFDVVVVVVFCKGHTSNSLVLYHSTV